MESSKQTTDEMFLSPSDRLRPTASSGAESKRQNVKRRPPEPRKSLGSDEVSLPNQERVEMIHKNDILFGRGKGFQNHPGNVRMRAIIDRHKRQYHSISRSEKQGMVNFVYSEILKEGARFLKRGDGNNFWVVVDSSFAKEKVGHALRRVGPALLNRENTGKTQVDKGEGTDRSEKPSGNPIESQSRINGPSRALSSAISRSDPMLPLNPMVSSDLLARADMIRLDAFNNRSLARNMLPMLGIPHYNTNMLEYYSILRQEQLIRDALLLQQRRRLMGHDTSSIISSVSSPAETLLLSNLNGNSRLNETSSLHDRNYRANSEG